MNEPGRDGPWPRLVWGITLLTAGLIFWLDRIDRIEASDYLEWWPLASIAAGLSYLPMRRWASAVAWLAVGFFFLLPKLGFPQLALWRVIGLWPLLISVAGVMVMVQALQRKEKERRGDSFRSAAVMGADVRVVRSENLAGGEAVAVMAGCDIDLSGTRALPEVVIDVLAFWGGIEIRVPAGWQVVDQVAEILGGFENKTSRAVEGAPRVVVRGAAIMGGIEVRNPTEGAV